MELISQFIKKHLKLLIRYPYLSSAMFTVVFSLIIMLILGLNFLEFLLIAILMAVALEAMTYLLVNEAGRKLESVLYIMDRIKNKDLNQSLDLTEFEGLESVSATFNSMIEDLRSIMGSLKTISLELVQASDMLNTNTEKINTTMDDLANTMDDIARGASEQAGEAEKGVDLITSLSQQIDLVHENAKGVATDSENMRGLNSQGLKAVETLRAANEESARTADEVLHFINSFVEKSRSIGEFVTTINHIAEQTNLLALNAAIEAARAGDAGRGFAVVADEVRKLADNSKKATEQVEEIMESIIQEADNASSMMDNMGIVVERQTEAVEHTTTSFNVIAKSIENIINRINDVSNAIAVMERDKNEVTSAMENISSVSEEAAAASQEIAATTLEQKNLISELAASSKNLNDLSRELRNYVEVYRV